jgi:Resolvase, N terminal domain
MSLRGVLASWLCWDRIAGNGVRTIIVESPDRFARDLAVQLAGHDHLRKLGVALIPATAPDFFTEDTPTAVLVRQVLGAIAQFEKATTVAKLKAARDRKIAAGEKCGGRKSYAEARPEMVELARQLRRPDPHRRPLSSRKVSAALAERGYVASTGRPYEAAVLEISGNILRKAQELAGEWRWIGEAMSTAATTKEKSLCYGQSPMSRKQKLTRLRSLAECKSRRWDG